MLPLRIIRISSLGQLEQLIDLACQVWADDPLFACVVPGRHEHPEHFRQMWSMHLRKEYGNTGTVILAACKEEDGEIGDAMAFAIWRRHVLIRYRVAFDMFYTLTFRQTGGSVSISDATEVMTGLRNAGRLYPAERWRLCWLGVSPKCQRTGIGKRLVQWGLDRCDEERVPAVLEASEPGRGLYEKMGFRQIGKSEFDKGRQIQPVMLREVQDAKKAV
ncbi:hypothetical protein FALBO_14848 [Fusarium albosuccineum]|uniref:N-acetyltransferase domain-containing protein n=1 Tax=Fusarium albosuccineum TaxID=1237068 RepID=A0A8H4KWA0_9HYPO|nr:hypothetical protein FALBO_14848 [Fusarium albosuccineum]